MADESIENAALTRPSRRQSATISVSWSGLAFAAGALALASTSSLAIVATIVKADALSTIALALAILSFIIQIGLFIAQSWTSGQQVLHSEELNSDTRAILAEVRENARGTNQMISDQFEKVLAHLLNTTKRTVDESVKGPEAKIINQRLDREFENAMRRRNSELVRERRTPTDEERTLLAAFRSYPSDPKELAESQEAISHLSPQGIIGLSALADDEMSALGSHGDYKKGLFSSLVRNADELLSAGLAEKVEPPSEWRDERQYQGQDYLVLTDKGRRVARLITGKKESNGRIVKELPEKPEGNPVA